MTTPHPSITIGIPTVLAGKHLVRTVASIFEQTIPVSAASVKIMLDGQPMPVSTLRALSPEIRVRKTASRQGQSAKLDDLLATSRSELIISTNDDVVWAQNALERIYAVRQSSRADLICVGVRPLPAHTVMEKILSVGTDIKNEVIRRTPGQQTYLVCNGRLLAVSAKLASKMRVPYNIWNNDAFMYLFAKRNGFTVAYIDEPLCAFRDPATLKEYILQTLKFQQSRKENEAVFGPLGSEYSIPMKVRIPAIFAVLRKRPWWGSIYLVLYLITRLVAVVVPLPQKHKPYWPIDMSTKELD